MNPDMLLAWAQSRPVETGLGAAAAVFFLSTLVLKSKLSGARAELDELRKKASSPPPPPPRAVECRREHVGLLWYPVLTVQDDRKLVTAAVAGKPHCIKCVRALSAVPSGEFVCPGCEDRRPGSAADMQVTDALIGASVKEWLSLHPDYRWGGAAGVKAGR